ncbi:MAG: hypothetical protein H7A37_00695 [Chlamydiales bacterium]|nr:hypothetical protein [Chlamydiia bacterium]MCP5506810.1 hypothetical protein [Chlamydiales bacterium]
MTGCKNEHEVRLKPPQIILQAARSLVLIVLFNFQALVAEEDFLLIERMLNGMLPVSEHAIEMTKEVLLFEELPGGWRLFGKAGCSSQCLTPTYRLDGLWAGWKRTINASFSPIGTWIEKST